MKKKQPLELAPCFVSFHPVKEKVAGDKGNSTVAVAVLDLDRCGRDEDGVTASMRAIKAHAAPNYVRLSSVILSTPSL